MKRIIGKYVKWCLFLIVLMISSCNSDNGTEPDPGNSSITGNIHYLDGSPGKFAPVELRKLSSSVLLYTNSDEFGNYTFDSLDAGNYRLRFRSTNSEINTYEVEFSLSENQNYEENLYILYKQINEFNAVKKSKEVYLIKYEPEAGKIGDNYQFVNYLSGTFSGDYNNQYTLSCDIYVMPSELDWFDSDSLFTRDYIIQNFEFVTSIEEINTNANHELRFYNDDIVKILSDPANGFVIVNKNIDGKELMIPCVDKVNNDFGLLINYN